MDVIASAEWLGPLVFRAAAKDATLRPGADVRGVLDTSFTRVPADAPGKVPWTEFLRALYEIDPDMAVNIEHEDAVYSQREGPALAAKNLHDAAAAL